MARQRAMPHIKSFGRYLHVQGQGTRLAWFCLASHNLSKAAWGNQQVGEACQKTSMAHALSEARIILHAGSRSIIS